MIKIWFIQIREFNLLAGYRKLAKARLVGKDFRAIDNRKNHLTEVKVFFDGNRNEGYGGFKYDGRWMPIAKRLIAELDTTGLPEPFEVEYFALVEDYDAKGIMRHDP